ncbi:MAG: CRTAC1 family protein, partial [bacterium]|nr:CRTAC1 family protein [bacterium]
LDPAFAQALDEASAGQVPEARQDGNNLRIPTDLAGAPNRLYRNNGDGSFSEISEETHTAGGAARSIGALFSDLDEDRDIDFVVVNDGEQAKVFSNERVGGFTETSSAWGIEAFGRLRGVDSADFDQDGNFDLFFTAEGSVLNLLLRGAAGSGFRPDVVSPRLLYAGVPGNRFGTAFADVDNDTDLDILLVVNEPGALVAVYENTSSGFRRAVDLDSSDDVGSARALAIADVDNDGKLDAAVGTDRGRVLLFRNESQATGGWLRILTRGLRSNKDGLGTKVEVKAGKARQRRETRAASSYLSQNSRPLHFGLGPHRAADYIRFLWPGGVKQIEMDVAGGQTVTI